MCRLASPLRAPLLLPKIVFNVHMALSNSEGVTVCLAAFAETQLRCRKRSCAHLVQLRAANASRAQIRSTIGSMGPQKPNEQYIERR